jgi:Collagen triple helix repeat (20 copies)
MPQATQEAATPGAVVGAGALISPGGDQGPAGVIGPTGIQGATGPAGPQGATGPQGIQGVAGPAGPTGPQGVPGPAGISTDAGNLAKAGSDGLILVPTSAIPPLSKYYGVDTGTATAYVVSVNSDFQLVAGVVVYVVPSNGSGANPTLNVNGTGAKPLVNRANIAIGTYSSNEIAINRMFGAMYDGTNWRVITPLVRLINTASANLTIECAGFDGVTGFFQFSVGNGITLAHLTPGIPITIWLYNSAAAAQPWYVNWTNLSGGGGNVTAWIWANSLTAGAGGVRIDSTNTQSLPPGMMFLVGSLFSNNQLYFI